MFLSPWLEKQLEPGDFAIAHFSSTGSMVGVCMEVYNHWKADDQSVFDKQ